MYEEGIDAFDKELASFLELVERTLGTSNTIVVLLSDHGEGFDHSRDRIHHGGRLHRDQLQVPLLVAGPGIAAGSSEELASLVDVRPSLLELAGVTDDVEHDGRSFARHLRHPHSKSLFERLLSFVRNTDAEESEDREAIKASDHSYYWQSGRRKRVSRPSKKPVTSARIDDEYWYIEDRSGEELYHVSDKRQEHSRVGERDVPRDADDSLSTPLSQPTQLEPSEELVEQLKALGYVE
jgi:arylsulfatase A-like enzyme